MDPEAMGDKLLELIAVTIPSYIGELRDIIERLFEKFEVDEKSRLIRERLNRIIDL